MSNVIKYSKAQNVQITLGRDHEFVYLDIKDDGIGFDLNKLKESTNSIGIQNCINRANLIHYDFIMESKINHGTTITLQEKV